MLILPIIAVVLVIVIFFVMKEVKGRLKNKKNSKGSEQIRDKQKIELAQKRYASNNKDVESLRQLADYSYKEGNYNDAVIKATEVIALTQGNKSIVVELYPYYVMQGLSYLKLKKYEEAFNGLSTAFTLKQEFNEELLAGLGCCEYYNKNYERAIGFTQTVLKSFPQNGMAHKYLGLSLYKTKKFAEAVAELSQIVADQGTDKELYFALANSYYETNQYDAALKIFDYLITDPEYSSSVGLFVGTILYRLNRYDDAITALQNALNRGSMRTEILVEIKHLLAQAYVHKKDFTNALDYFMQVKSVNPSYKNVVDKVAQYSELVSNSNFNSYCNGSNADFLALARKILPHLFAKMSTKILEVLTTRPDYVDMLVEIRNSRMSDTIYVRFYRIEVTLDEVHLRDLYNKIRDQNYNRGLCVVPGSFTPSAENFVEQRLIDLVGKEALIKILVKIK